MKRFATGMCLALIGASTAWAQGNDHGAQCSSLAKLELPHRSIVSAQAIDAGKLRLSADDKDPVYARLPAFCRVVANSQPSADSKIAIEVWLPLEGWNGRFLGVGNGGFAGEIDYHRLAVAVLRGYATAATDTGHQASGIDASWALHHPEKIADFGHRAIHEMSLTGESTTKAFYSRGADHRYFASCSDGGREALMEAQRYADDYDGILAGAPAYNWSHLVSSGLHGVQALHGKLGSYIPAAKLPAINKAVLAQCGGTEAGFLDDPSQCHFNPDVLLCKRRENAECLTHAQLGALKTLYADARTKDGTVIDHGEMPGAELGDGGWALWITGSAPGKSLLWAFVNGYFEDMVYGKSEVDVTRIDADKAFALAVERTSADLDAVNPDLSSFSAHGGKLILYHGWNDPAIPALGTVDYFNRVAAAAGAEKAAQFTRLFLVPGMQHCAGGPGATIFGQGGPDEYSSRDDSDNSIYRALETWVESGTAPEKVVARKFEEHNGKSAETMSRPICAYPKAATYTGSGDRADAASYTCAAEK